MEWIKELLTLFWDYLKFWILVNHYEESVQLRCGKYYRTLTAGLYFKWPFIDYALDVYIKPDTMEIEPLSITTSDGKNISIGLMIEFQITDSRKFKVEVNDALSNMRDIARGEMSDHLEDFGWEDIKKKTTKNALKRKLQEHYVDMGVDVHDLKFTHKTENRVFRLLSDNKNIF